MLAGLTSAVPAASQQALGRISFPTSGAPAAQPEFIRGVLLLHSFQYEEAAEAFRAAQHLDPGFAMAYWGEALTHTHQVWNQQDLPAARAVLARLGPTAGARRARAPTPREQAYLGSIELLYGDGSKPARDTLYAGALEALVQANPDDDEAKTFYSVALLGLSQGIRNIPTYMRAGAIAEDVFRRNDDHPGAAHFIIHAFDDPIHAPLGLYAARRYSVIAPGASHAQHMTTHIFLALGMWDDVARQNEVAAGPARDHWRPGHYTHWLGYAYLQQGRREEAARLVGVLASNSSTPGGRGQLANIRAPPAVVAPGHETLGRIYLAAGKPAEAAREFERALGSDQAGPPRCSVWPAPRKQAAEPISPPGPWRPFGRIGSMPIPMSPPS